MSDLTVSMSATGFVGLTSEKVLAETANKASDVAIKNVGPDTIGAEIKTEQAEKAKQAPPAEEVEVAVEEMNAFVQSMQRNLSFSIDEQLGQAIISVKDGETDEVIRQIPSEELVVLRKKMDDVVGILFEAKV